MANVPDNELRFASRCVHAGQRPDPATGAVMTPIYQTSTYAQESPGVFKENYDYSRSANPTRTALEANLAALENGKHGICFASGCAAFDSALHLLDAGDHVVLSDDVYGGTFRLVDKLYTRHAIDYTVADLTDQAAVEAAFTKKTRLLWVETPSNPMLKVIDLRVMADIAHSRGALLAVDNTFATPFLQNPLDLAADIVCHSLTKYLAGHSDMVGGALIVNDDELADRLHYNQNAIGAVPAPFECFLALRSTKTLHLRMQRHCDNARRLAAFLDQHKAIETVTYPGLPSHPQHDIAKKQMRDFGGMITATLAGGLDASRRFLERVRVFTLAESLGGVESLVEHPAIMTHATIPPDQRARLGLSDALVRFSVGVEDIEDLVADAEQALA